MYFDKTRKAWRAVFWNNGTRKTKLFPKKNDARTWEVNQAEELKTERPTATIRTASLHEAATAYLDFVKIRFSKSTYAAKQKVLKELIAETGNPMLNDIVPEAVERFIYSFKKPPTVNKALKNIRAFFNWTTQRHGFGLQFNPTLPIERLPHSPALQIVPTDEEIARIRIVADAFDRAMIDVAVSTAARRSSIFRLTWTDDVNFEQRTIRIGNRKNRSSDMIYHWKPLNALALNALKFLYKNRINGNDFVFQNRASWIDKDGNVVRKHPNFGGRFTTRRKFVRGLCKKAGVRIFNWHSLRRYTASRLADREKISLPTIQNLLDHARVSTTDVYIKGMVPEAVREAVETIVFEENDTQTDTQTGKKYELLS